MSDNKVIPVLRIFDFDKAKEFYIDWLGFKIDWVHRFGDNFPLYLQVSKDELVLHLSEHHGDASPGSKVFIEFTELGKYHAGLLEKNYKYSKPGLEDAFWGAKSMEVIDPFGNKLLFSSRSEV